jgi:hypothetical protein
MSDDPNGESKAQTERILNQPGSEPYTLTEDDINGCRGLLKQLLEADERTGPYAITSMQGYQRKASAVVEFNPGGGPEANARGLELLIESGPKLGQLCKKVIAHWDSRPQDVQFNQMWERMQKLEAFLAAHDAVECSPGSYDDAVMRLRAARKALG